MKLRDKLLEKIEVSKDFAEQINIAIDAWNECMSLAKDEGMEKSVVNELKKISNFMYKLVQRLNS